MRNADDTFKNGFEDTGRNIERILEEKRNAGLPQTRIITSTGPTPEELFRAQAIFEADGSTMTPDAKLLVESNLRLYVLNTSSLRNLPIDTILS
jgi:hypothetical protein